MDVLYKWLLIWNLFVNWSRSEALNGRPLIAGFFDELCDTQLTLSNGHKDLTDVSKRKRALVAVKRLLCG